MSLWSFAYGFSLATAEGAEISRFDWEVIDGRDPNRLVFKFHEESGLTADDLDRVFPFLVGHARPLFPQLPEMLEKRHRRLRSVEDLRTYVVVQGNSEWLDGVAADLMRDERLEHLYRDFLPQTPPMDIPPTTPSFASDQLDHVEAPLGFGFAAGRQWSSGSEIRIANIEYSYDPLHEDLQSAPVTHVFGWNVEQWAYHGNAVLGQLIATDNAYGVTGIVPDAEVLMVSPYPEANEYNVAASLVATLDWLVTGDVVLIEQQAYGWENYCPIEYIPAVFDAIQWLTAEGIVVVEPSGNGAADLDNEQWEGWFDSFVQDSGAVMVGGSGGVREPLRWSGGSSYGSRIDVQGWFEGIATTSTWEMADLYYPEQDTRQAYTQYFGGTSGASPQIVGVVAQFNSAILEQGNTPWAPNQIRALLRQTGRSQPAEDRTTAIGSQPDVATLLRMWAW